MWGDILLSITMSISEAIGCSYIEKKKKEKMLKELSKIISENFEEFADSSLDCNDFYLLIKSKKFIEIIRNFFVSIHDGMDRSHYIENVERYIFDECTNIDQNEVGTFLKKIEKVYVNHLHKMVQDYPGIYALFQLMTISHREIINKILENEKNIQRYFNALECKKIQIDNENINLFHSVSQKEYGTIRFTGISGAERKREQNINEFYVENTFSYYGKEIEKLYNCGLDEIEIIKLENFFDFGNKIVLIGGAGLGKSTTLNYLYCNYERMYQAYAVKIKIDLKEYAKEIGEKKKGLLWCITNEFAKRSKYVKLSFDEIQSVLSDYLDNGKCLIILDALDEIPTLAIRNKVRDEIAIFCELYYLNRFIISTREAGYLRNRFDETFLHIKINQFSNDQIKKYSANWFKLYYNNSDNFKEFWEKFEKEVTRARCENIISNPIILILALVIFDIEKNLPTRRIEFYQKCIETFLTERENRKGAYVLEDKTKSILSVNLTLPKIAYYKFEHLKENVGYRFVYSELENSVYNSIGVIDILNWASAVKQYIEYLVERTELVQEIDENIYDFAHKTFYEYFLAFYFCKTYENEELVNLLGNWIGDSNNDELARLIIEAVIQNNQPRQHDCVIEYLFNRLKSGSIIDNRHEKMDIFLIIVDLYNHNMLQPKFYADYNLFILYNSQYVDQINEGMFFYNRRSCERVQYDAPILAELFYDRGIDKGDMLNVIDSLLYLNRDYKRHIMRKERSKHIEHIISLFECIYRGNPKKEIRKQREKCKKEIDYFLNDGIQYLHDYPQIFLAVINLSLELDEKIDIEKLLACTFEKNDKFYSYTNPRILYKFLNKAQSEPGYLLLFLVSIIKCLHKRSNAIIEYALRHARNERFEGETERVALDKAVEFAYCLWKDLNETRTYQEFKNRLFQRNLFINEYDDLYEELYLSYIENEKGVLDEGIKEFSINSNLPTKRVALKI